MFALVMPSSVEVRDRHKDDKDRSNGVEVNPRKKMRIDVSMASIKGEDALAGRRT